MNFQKFLLTLANFDYKCLKNHKQKQTINTSTKKLRRYPQETQVKDHKDRKKLLTAGIKF